MSTLTPASGYADDNIKTSMSNADNTEHETQSDVTTKMSKGRRYRLTSVFSFTLFCGLSQLFSGLVRTIMNTQIEAFERQFGISSSLSGMFTTANTLGIACTLMATSHFARSVNIPRTVGITGVIIGSIEIVSGLLYFIEPYHPGDVTTSSYDNSTNSSITTDRFTCHMANTSTDASDEESQKRNLMAYYALIAIMFTKGLLQSLRFTLPTIFIDNNVLDKTKVGIYLGVLAIAAELQDPFGEFLNGFISNIPVDLAESTLPVHDPRFVSAWWLGFLMFGSCNLLSSLPMLFMQRDVIPRKQQEEALKEALLTFSGITKKTGEQENDDIIGMADNKLDTSSTISSSQSSVDKEVAKVLLKQDEDNKNKSALEEIKITLKELPRSMRRIFTNVMWVLLMVQETAGYVGWYGTGPFSIKYMIVEYHVSQSMANTYRGLSTTITSIVGTLIGAAVSTRLHTRRAYISMLLMTAILSSAISFLSLIYGCNNTTILGKQGYLGGEISNISRTCECDDSNTLLSCGDDGNTYLSPCHAGCTIKNGTGYTDCANLETIANGTGLNVDSCDPDCFINFIIYIAVKASDVFLYQLSYLSISMLLLRLTHPDDRATSQAVFSLMITIVSIPAPIIWGKLIDTACSIWTGQCAYYDRDHIRNIVAGTAVTSRFTALVAFALMLFISIHQDSRFQAKTNTNGTSEKGNIPEEKSDKKQESVELQNTTDREMKKSSSNGLTDKDSPANLVSVTYF